MRKAFPLVFITMALGANVPAQSGRRLTNPPPPVERVSEPVTVAPPDYLPPAPAELSALPDSVLNRDLRSFDQGTFRLADFSGKVIVVNLWASWCGPCRMEVPDYEKVRKQYAGRGVEFIGLTTEDPRTSLERAQKFARDLNFRFRLGWADPQTARIPMNGRRVIPQTLVIAGNGRVVSHWNGYSPSQSRDRLRDILDRALSESPSQK